VKAFWWLPVVSAVACSGQNSHLYSDSKAAPIHRVCVLPAEATLTRAGMKGGESLTKESDEWAAKLGGALQHAITEAGGQLSGDLSTEALNKSEAERQTVLQVRQKYKSVFVQMRRKQDDIKKGRYIVGDEISLLPCTREADSVVFLDASGLVQTSGRKTLTILTGGFLGVPMAMSRYQMWVAFVDAKTGVMTAMLRMNSRGGKAGTDPEKALNNSLVSQFKRLHMGTP